VPVTVPDMGTSIASVTCNGTTLTLSGTTPAEAGGNRCSGGTNHHNACTANADCPGGACKFLRCTNPGCLFGPPLPIPASAHNAAAISTCVINTVSQNASGTADCGTGTTTSYSIPLSSAVFLTSDLMLMRCSGGSNPGGDYPTSHDCPPPPPNFIGAPPIALVLDSGTISRTAVDLSDQVNVFCGFCKNGVAGFARTCNGSPTGALCSCAIGTPCAACSGAP